MGRSGPTDRGRHRGGVILKSYLRLLAAIVAGISLACSAESESRPESEGAADVLLPEEVHLSNARQLTNGGENAEAYFSSDDRYLILQSTHGEYSCDQIFT